MIANAPIRGPINQVELSTANAVKEFFELCQAADPESGYVALPPDVQRRVVSVNESMGVVAEKQGDLIQLLDKVSQDDLASPSFQKVISDLERLVLQGDSAISDAYTAPDPIVKLWQKNLDLMSQRNSHIDSYVESFRITFDETCSSLLADLATKVIAA